MGGMTPCNDSITIPDKPPCEHPCESPCEQQQCAGKQAFWTDLMRSSLINTLDVCFDDVYAEPKKILMVGGCRQRDLAQHVALLLPAADIVLVDPDAVETEKAEKEICCRFKFITAPLEALPFEDGAFDLTIAHNALAYAQNWPQAISEITRVSNKNVLLSVHRPWLWKLFQGFSPIKAAMTKLGTFDLPTLPTQYDFLSRLTLYAKIKTRLKPFPWTFYMTEVKPNREERLVLGP